MTDIPKCKTDGFEVCELHPGLRETLDKVADHVSTTRTNVVWLMRLGWGILAFILAAMSITVPMFYADKKDNAVRIDILRDIVSVNTLRLTNLEKSDERMVRAIDDVNRLIKELHQRDLYQPRDTSQPRKGD